MKSKDTVGGWSWWLRQVREANPNEKLDVDALLLKYIKGVKWENAV